MHLLAVKEDDAIRRMQVDADATSLIGFCKYKKILINKDDFDKKIILFVLK